MYKCILYSGNLSRQKTYANWWKIEFRGLLAHTVYCRLSLQTITEKIFVDRHKTASFTKVFSLDSFPLYGMYCVIIPPPTHTNRDGFFFLLSVSVRFNNKALPLSFDLDKA